MPLYFPEGAFSVGVLMGLMRDGGPPQLESGGKIA